jgi:hypothetical protein
MLKILIEDPGAKLDLRDLLFEAVEPIAWQARSVGDRDDLHFVRLDKEMDYVSKPSSQRETNIQFWSRELTFLEAEWIYFDSLQGNVNRLPKLIAESNTL